MVYLHNVYAGPGLAGVPRGAVKRLRIAAYHYGYPGMAGPDKIGRARTVGCDADSRNGAGPRGRLGAVSRAGVYADHAFSRWTPTARRWR